MDDFGVARIRRLTAEHARAPLGAAENFVDLRQLHHGNALPAQMRPHMRRPQALITHDLLQRLDRRHRLLVGYIVGMAELVEHQIERLNLLADELLDPVQLLLKLRLC